MAHLPVLAFDEGELYPAGRDVGAVADGRNAFPEVFGSFNDFCLTALGAVAFDDDTLLQLVHGLLRDLSVHLGEIGAWMLELRVKQLLDEGSVVGEEQGALAVVVEATGGIHACWETKLVERPMSGLGSELAEYAERLVEDDDHGFS